MPLEICSCPFLAKVNCGKGNAYLQLFLWLFSYSSDFSTTTNYSLRYLTNWPLQKKSTVQLMSWLYFKCYFNLYQWCFYCSIFNSIKPKLTLLFVEKRVWLYVINFPNWISSKWLKNTMEQIKFGRREATLFFCP